MSIEEIKTQISHGNIEGVLNALILQKESHRDAEDLKKRIMALSSRFHQLKREQLGGTIDDLQYRLQLNRITVALIELANEIQEKSLTTHIGLYNPFTRKYWMLGIFVIVIIISVILTRAVNSGADAGSMQLTVYVHGPKGLTDIPTKHVGKIIVDFDNDRRSPSIGENGRTNLGEIPEKFRNSEIIIGLDAKGFQPAYPSKKYKLDGKPVYFEVQSSCLSCRIFGTVRRQEGFVHGAIVSIPAFEVADTTNENGFFEINLSPEKEQAEYPLTVLINGKIVWEKFVTPAPGVPSEILINNIR